MTTKGGKRPQQPKRRNFEAKAVRDPQGPLPPSSY